MRVTKGEKETRGENWRLRGSRRDGVIRREMLSWWQNQEERVMLNDGGSPGRHLCNCQLLPLLLPLLGRWWGC